MSRAASIARLTVLALVAVFAFGGGIAATERVETSDHETFVAQAFGDLPLSFEPNRGQADPSVRFLARGDGYTAYLTGSGAVFSLSGHPVEMDLVGAAPEPPIVGRDALPGVVNYFKGSDPSGWLPGIPTYGRVRYADVYPGIDLLFRGSGEGLEYDFVVAPGADPQAISMRFRSSESLRIEGDDLVIATPAGEIVHRDPVVYQEIGESRLEIPAGYRLHGDRVSFAVGPHDPTRPLIIDPVVLAYSTFLGGGLQEEGLAIDVDAAGAAYVTGSTDDATTDFPTTGGAFDTTHNGGKDVFVTKIAPDGASLVYSTFLGGAVTDEGFGIAVDGAGAAFVTGRTNSPAFPATGGAFDTSHNGGYDVFVTKVPPSGAGPLAYSTFLGGTEEDVGLEIAVDGTGAAFVTGSTRDPNFPTTPGAAYPTHNGDRDVFVTKLDPNPAGTGPEDLIYSTFLGGSSFDIGSGIAVDATGAAFVAGSTDDDVTDFPTTGGAFDETHNGSTDVFVTKIGPSGVGPVSYSTFIGGAQFDEGFAVAVDGTSAAYVTGETLQATPTFPTTAGAFDTTHNGDYDAYVAKLNAAGAGLVYSTFLGGSAYDFGRGIAVDGTGAAHLTGMTTDGTTDFPTTTGAHDETANGGQDAYVTALSPGGNSPLTYSTFLGGSGNDEGQGIALDGTGGIYAIGSTFDDVTDFPTTAGAFDTTHNGNYDAYVAKVADVPAPAPGPSPGTCKGKAATLTGTESAENISGTSGADVIAALGGNDRISAKGGKDLVCAGAGNDTANGGGGKDRVFGEDGKDRLKGSSGNDRLNGGAGKDTCAGGSGKDRSPACEKEKTIP